MPATKERTAEQVRDEHARATETLEGLRAELDHTRQELETATAREALSVEEAVCGGKQPKSSRRVADPAVRELRLDTEGSARRGGGSGGPLAVTSEPL